MDIPLPGGCEWFSSCQVDLIMLHSLVFGENIEKVCQQLVVADKLCRFRNNLKWGVYFHLSIKYAHVLCSNTKGQYLPGVYLISDSIYQTYTEFVHVHTTMFSDNEVYTWVSRVCTSMCCTTKMSITLSMYQVCKCVYTTNIPKT